MRSTTSTGPAATCSKGSLLDTKARSNLTRERVESLHPLTFENAPLQDAIAIKRGQEAEVGAFRRPKLPSAKVGGELEGRG